MGHRLAPALPQCRPMTERQVDKEKLMKGSSITNICGKLSLIALLCSALVILSVIVWQGLAAHGAPDPLQSNTSSTVAFLDIGVLVFREGLECILVLAAVTASLTGTKQAHRRPVAIGAGIGFGATLITWFIAIGIVGSLMDNVPALDLQAATGLLAVIVVL